MNTTVTLHAPGLLLRPWCADDTAALVEAYRDPALRRWTSARLEDEADALRWVREQERGWAAGERFGFAVLSTPPGRDAPELVGNVVLKGVAAGRPSAEVGYWTAARARGRGVAPRALGALTTWAFDTFRADGLERLELLHQSDNEASCAVARKSGYAFARTLPAAPPDYPLDGHLHLRRATP
ncbi:GNAT family N-acetyltransferase [Streptantibioticus cattleyicolor]|uniref:Acetyltransferase n=1 Tax=Streptantibioticus cattleyicolor (strain ATCC 35852 / DSM 46488 / JCM 4925 / NBRC 14057 / NRRL 8057) TaxID=1003195 RepID=F8JJB5_STREN|nr:GNAT family N-acetyltransferase [Streptantibioticus cattleyicolor]AEW98773.1 acetyltransferase [Streptantibioticus cattleyicolor NRRL 8057 = DSM 46488]CCB72176.1 Acetyltransferase [Streptantibioticus cattleyicolor NRRL 8057 = DSM 46488]